MNDNSLSRSSTPKEFYYEELREREQSKEKSVQDEVIDDCFSLICKLYHDYNHRGCTKYNCANYIRMLICKVIYCMSWINIPFDPKIILNCDTRHCRKLAYAIEDHKFVLRTSFKRKFGIAYDDDAVISYCREHTELRYYLLKEERN